MGKRIMINGLDRHLFPSNDWGTESARILQSVSTSNFNKLVQDACWERREPGTLLRTRLLADLQRHFSGKQTYTAVEFVILQYMT
jgi:hypothetical protein